MKKRPFRWTPHTDPQFGRIAELDALHVRPKGEGHGWPESLPIEKKWGEGGGDCGVMSLLPWREKERMRGNILRHLHD